MEKVKTYEYEASLLEAKLRGQGQKVRAPLRAIWEHRVGIFVFVVAHVDNLSLVL